MSNFLRNIFYIISKNNFIYRVANRLVFDHRGENNNDISINGEMYFLQNYLKYCKVIFDVGANIGDWTKTVLSVKSEASVFCFEPAKDTFSKLSENNFPNNVILNNIGLGSSKSEVEFFIYEQGNVLNSLYDRQGVGLSSSKKEKVLLDTIYDFCQTNNIDKVDLLKIDVEGNELEVLKGAQSMIKNGKIGMIQLEYGGTYIDAGILLKDIFDFFVGTDYVIYKILPDKLLPILEYDQKLENFQYSNYVIMNKNFCKV